MPPAIGMLSIRIKVLEDGSVESLDWLSDTLVPIPGAPVLALDGASVEPPEDARQLILEVIVENLAEVGYDNSDLYVHPYDWRMDATRLEKRDGLLTRMKHTFESSLEGKKPFSCF